jgi:multiple sugar transport system permease protein
VPVSVLVASLAGFAMTQLPRRVTAAVVAASLVALMAPATALLVPRFALFRALGLTDTLVPLMAPALLATSPLYPLVFYLAFRSLPADLYDACRLEDLSPLRTWWRVAMPLVHPVTAAIAALTFVLTWSNFLDPLVYVYDRDLFTLPLALRSLATLDPTNYPVFLAGAVLTTIPSLAVFGLAQRRFLHQYRE